MASDIDAVKRLQSLIDLAEKEDEYRAEYQKENVAMSHHYEYIHRERMRLDSETVDVEISKGQALALVTLAINAREELVVIRQKFPHLFV